MFEMISEVLKIESCSLWMPYCKSEKLFVDRESFCFKIKVSIKSNFKLSFWHPVGTFAHKNKLFGESGSENKTKAAYIGKKKCCADSKTYISMPFLTWDVMDWHSLSRVVQYGGGGSGPPSIGFHPHGDLSQPSTKLWVPHGGMEPLHVDVDVKWYLT